MAFRKLATVALTLLGAFLIACPSNEDQTADTYVPTDTTALDVPAVDLPSSDLPAADVPAVDAPAVDVPVVDTPAVDVPVIDTPAADVPATDAPAADVPATDVPAADTPAIDVPAVDTPAADVPAVDAPVADTAVVDIPEVTLVTFTGELVDFASKKARQGVDLVVLSNETGEPLDPVKYPPFKSGVNGRFTLELPAGIEIGFKATGKEDPAPPPPGKAMVFQTTYMFNIPSDAQNKRIYAVNTITYMTAPRTAGITVDKTKGILAGTVYYKVPGTNEEQFVGCATIEAVPADGSSTTPMGEVRYFDPRNDLPGSLEVAQFTTTGLEGTSRYIIANLPVGKYKLIVKVDGVQVNTGAAEVTVGSYVDSISVSNVYVTGAGGTNPTPSRPVCTVDEVDPS